MTPAKRANTSFTFLRSYANSRIALRGELLKAMGEVMIKHGQAMSGEQ